MAARFKWVAAYLERAMDLHHLHELRDGKAAPKRRAFNSFIHVATDTPMMRVLFNITRPANDVPETKTPIVRAAKKKIAAATKMGGSMVSYTKERPKL